ncbi:MAG: ribosome recycling factor [Armatimonadetes bacterium]|nr:ribosome recycling factor [Armatimonadota bacterium]MBS1711922.1 ribosome recycling factor [Armatimonadota bacterium]MBX3109524.1 ribosome recycling factor [Fimbriimonadaceae bacterium]
MSEVLKDAEHKMQSAVEATVHDFGRIRTGRASAQVLEPIMVDYYGTPTPITQCANVSVPEPRQILISPYDKSMTGAIERAIQNSDLGINPNNDGTGIRLNFPPMNEERRKDLVKEVAKRSEEGCVAIRNVRHHALNALRDQQKNKEITEDDLKGLEKKLQDLTDKYVANTHEAQKKKEAEVMEI